jgi:hypothetical protein
LEDETMFTNASIFGNISNELNINGSNNKSPSLTFCCNNRQCQNMDCDTICGWKTDPKLPDVSITARDCVNKGCSQRCKNKDGSWYDPGICCDNPRTYTFYVPRETGIEIVKIEGCAKMDNEGNVTIVVPSCEKTCGQSNIPD